MLSYARSHARLEPTLSLASTVDNQKWNSTTTEKAEYIEASRFATAHESANGSDDVAYCCRYGTLVDDEILDWITRSGSYMSLKSQDTSEILQGGIRLLVLERSSCQLPSFDIKKATYLTIEKYFNLPENTLLALSDECGMSTHTLDIDEGTGTLKRLGMVIKASQKFQVGNYGLAFSYDFATGISTGILHGTGVAKHGQDYGLWSKSAAAEIHKHIEASHRFWAHPLFLPTTLIQHHLLRTDYFCTVILSNQLTDVQRQLGVMRAGRLYGSQIREVATELPVQQAKVNLRKLTVALSSLMYEAIWFCSVSDWQCSCLKHLGEVLTELNGLNRSLKETSFIRARIQHLVASAESIKRHNNALQENGQADMNILYSIISQVDNRLSARLAAASVRDSAAMKTLAFLTTLFLPGTFIATMFSTGMFSWQGSSDDSGSKKVVSNLFWVYWAFTVPLTVIVAVGWRLWWSWEKKRFDDDVDTGTQSN